MKILTYFSLLCIISKSICGPPPPCSPGWYPFGSSCYMISHYEMSWFDAKMFCQSNHGYLVEVESQEEQEFLAVFMSSDASTGAYWLGLSDMDEEGLWKWQESFSEATYTNWVSENPHNDTNRNCAETSMSMDIDGKNWYDISCEVVRDPATGWGLHAICETGQYIPGPML